VLHCCAIMKVVETLLFDEFVDLLIHAQKVIHGVPQLLMINSPVLPLVKVFEDPWISVSPPRGMATKYKATQCRNTTSKIKLCHHEEEELLRMKVVVSKPRRHMDISVVWGSQLHKTELVIDPKEHFLSEQCIEETFLQCPAVEAIIFPGEVVETVTFLPAEEYHATKN
jgi:hypothetical protein